MRLVENRGGGVWRVPGRYYRLRQETRDRGIQVARLPHFVQIRTEQGRPAGSCLRQCYGSGVPEVVSLSAYVSIRVIGSCSRGQCRTPNLGRASLYKI